MTWALWHGNYFRQGLCKENELFLFLFLMNIAHKMHCLLCYVLGHKKNSSFEKKLTASAPYGLYGSQKVLRSASLGWSQSDSSQVTSFSSALYQKQIIIRKVAWRKCLKEKGVTELLVVSCLSNKDWLTFSTLLTRTGSFPCFKSLRCGFLCGFLDQVWNQINIF